MKIEYIHIQGYKNLDDIELHFAEGSSVNSLIGNNGSGKSNILEVLTIIFSNVLEYTNPTECKFSLEYSIDYKKIKIENITGELSIQNDGERVLKKNVGLIMPKALFLYYAGETERLKRFAINSIDKRFDKRLKNDEEIALKFLTYLSVDDFGPSLLSNYIYQNETYRNICELVDIQDICAPVTIGLKRPSWSKNGKPDNFWNAIGAVSKVLHSFKEKGKYEIIDSITSKIIVDDLNLLRDDSIGAIGLFTIFKVLSQADILESVEYEVIKGNKRMCITSLSEGEKQLSQLLSILEATKEYKALFLLDEFDSYLHPKWQRKFVEMVTSIDIRGQILFTTHSPLTLSKMKKENILLLKGGMVYNPSSETFNRDITEVLEELMDVEKRPPEVEVMIKGFKESVIRKEVEKANGILIQLKEVLTADDPFFVNAEISMSRLARVSK